MKVENLFHILLIILLGCVSCKPKSSKPGSESRVQFQLSSDSSTIVLHHANAALLEYLREDSLSEKQWQSFFSVYTDPGDEELRDIQKPIQGQYLLRDSLIIFVPAEKFHQGVKYFARFYNRHVLDKPSDVIRERKLGESEFTEFSFKMGREK